MLTYVTGSLATRIIFQQCSSKLERSLRPYARADILKLILLVVVLLLGFLVYLLISL